MRFLLDTNVLLRSVQTPVNLSRDIADEIADVRNDVIFSVASIWEIGIKSALRRSDFRVDPELILQIARADFEEAIITSADVLRAAAFPLHHRDPFDRLIIAQTLERDATLLTTDRFLLPYAGQIRLVA